MRRNVDRPPRSEVDIAAQHLETTDCPLCGSSRRLATPYGRGPLRVVRCRSCLVYYLSPRLTSTRMAELYRDGAYFEGGSLGYSSYGRQERSLRKTFRRLVRILRRRKLTGGALLEVGCGYGYFLEAARPFYTRRVGTEMSADAAATARGTGAEVHVGGLEELPGGERFDLVVALHVIEHVYDPVVFVDRLLAHVKEGGHLLLATPDMGSHWRRVLGKRWPSFKYPEHVVLYDRQTLGSLMNRFEPLADLRRFPCPHAFPLSEVLNKLGVGVSTPSLFDRATVWIPGTTIALLGRYAG